MKSEQHETMSEEKFLSFMAWGKDTVLVALGQGDGEEAEEIEIKLDDAIAALEMIKASKALIRVSLIHAPTKDGL